MRGGDASGVGERAHTRSMRGFDTIATVLHDGAGGRPHAHPRGSMQEKIGSRLAARHLGGAEHALIEAGEESCKAKGETHLVMSAARRHASLGGDAIERFHDT